MGFDKELMERLSDSFSPSGREKQVSKLIIDEIKSSVDDVSIDNLGNIIAHKQGRGKKIMLSAHMDQIGMAVTKIEDKGYLRLCSIGGCGLYSVVNHRVIFANGMQGVVCVDDGSDDKGLKLDNLYIDLGISDVDYIKKNIRVGDMCVLSSQFYENEQCIIGRAIDNRIGCYMLIELIKEGIETANDIYYVFTSQEEVGIRGAKVAGYSVRPDLCVAVDVTITGDSPNWKEPVCSLGGGAAIKVKDGTIIVNEDIVDLLIGLAEKNDIKYQMDIFGSGGTDAGAVHLINEGILCSIVSVPCRNLHSANEIVDKSDVLEGIKLLQSIICEYR